MDKEQIKRTKRAARFAALFVCAGLLYGIAVSELGFGIPCMFHLVTGLRCPGCGITHACVALLNLDFAEAMRSNAMLLPTAIYLGIVTVNCTVRYIKKGKYKLSSGSDLLDAAFGVLIILWWVIRNIYGI